jgi:hypothetical protein
MNTIAVVSQGRKVANVIGSQASGMIRHFNKTKPNGEVIKATGIPLADAETTGNMWEMARGNGIKSLSSKEGKISSKYAAVA